MSSDTADDALIDLVAEALYASWFPSGNDTDEATWREIADMDACVAVQTIRNALATEIEAYARENHRHVDIGGMCPMTRSSADTCDLVAAYRNAARLVRGE